MILLAIAIFTLIIGFFILAYASSKQLNKALGDIDKSVGEKLNWITQQVEGRLRDNSQSLQNASVELGSKLESAVKAVSDVHEHLGKLEESHKQIYDVGKDISSLQNLLRAPKIRGGIGEFFLENILKQIMPSKEYFTFQHEFKSGEKVDAVIKFGKGLVPIDAKFPLENFRKFMDATDDKDRISFRKQFIADVKTHIKSISDKYIKPDEGTFDFALMYIPAENVYYETIIKDESFGEVDSGLFQHALARKVIPVSPNSFYAYLQVILLGLKGMTVEKSAQEILQNIGRLRSDLSKFSEDFIKVGKHLSHSKLSFDQAEKHLIRFTDKLHQIESPETKQIEST